MMLENLFARDGQTQAFLWLMAGGLALGIMLHGTEIVRRRHPWWGRVGDIGCALAMGLMLLGAVLGSGGGVRIYCLLGLTVGMLLYMAGIRQAISFLWRLLRRIGKKSGASAEV